MGPCERRCADERQAADAMLGPGYMGEDPPWARFVNPKAAWPSPTEKRSSSMMSEVRDLTADDLIEEQAREAKRFRHGYPSGTLHAAWME